MHGLNAAMLTQKGTASQVGDCADATRKLWVLGDDVIAGTTTVLRLSSNETGQFAISGVLLPPRQMRLQPNSCPDM